MISRSESETPIGVVTASLDEIADGALYTLLDSLTNQPIRLLVVLRGPVSSRTKERLETHDVVWSTIHVAPCGVSAARNAGIQWLGTLAGGEVSMSCWIGFPDDDCSYPVEYWATVRTLSHEVGLALGGYDEQGSSVLGEPVPLTPLIATQRATSIGILVRWGWLRRLGGFDESFGVGSGVIEGGEDLEFLLHALRSGARGWFLPSLRAIHPVAREVPADRRGSHIVVARRYWATPTCLMVVTKGLLRAFFMGDGFWPTARLSLRGVPVRRLTAVEG